MYFSDVLMISLWQKIIIHHKSFEIVGLVLALSAWVADLHVQNVVTYKTACDGQLMHAIESFQHYDSRDRILTETLAFLAIQSVPYSTPGPILDVALEKFSSVRQSWWDMVNTEVLWIERIDEISRECTTRLGIELPSSLASIKSKIAELKKIIKLHNTNKTNKPWDNIKKEDSLQIINLVDDILIGISDGSNEIGLATYDKRHKIKLIYIYLAGIGSFMIVIGKFFAWRLDIHKENLSNQAKLSNNVILSMEDSEQDKSNQAT